MLDKRTRHRREADYKGTHCLCVPRLIIDLWKGVVSELSIVRER